MKTKNQTKTKGRPTIYPNGVRMITLSIDNNLYKIGKEKGISFTKVFNSALREMFKNELQRGEQ